MEVLSRRLRGCVGDQFSFHPHCARLKLNNLIFADDLLIFTRGDLPPVAAVADWLSSFAKFSELHANVNDTHVYFGGVTPPIKRQILQFTRFDEGYFPFRYLGVPMTGGRLKVCHYPPLIDKLVKKVHHWTASSLSHAGKIQLIDSVLFSHLVYWCSVFMLPKHVAHQIESIASKFYWGSSSDLLKIHWLKWGFFCRPKLEGGVGIKEILSWNKALLLKWLWKITVGVPSLWLKWMNSYLLHEQVVWTVEPKQTDPWVWHEILKVRDEFVGKYGSLDAAISLIGSWGAGAGTGSLAGKFCTRKAYFFIRQSSPCVQQLKCISEPLALPKHCIVCWTVYHGRLATVDNLQRRGFYFANRCFLSKHDLESHDHLFFKCSYVTEVWRSMWGWLGSTRQPRSFQQEIEWLYIHHRGSNYLARAFKMVFVAIVYHCWIERNNRVFCNTKHDSSYVCKQIQFELPCRRYNRCN
ncbi:hypothetical protein RND81_09G069300 [Saponaria officinalis]|uniref:Reverse transcriptase zinc-binding domain-containing protein n=1 Tax=Saponaria officinalis TaxID=3572 RepID=A0AAW1IJQ4_SAPOF